jgi:hypothetical protein
MRAARRPSVVAFAPITALALAAGHAAACGGGDDSAQPDGGASQQDAYVEHDRAPFDGSPTPEAGPRTPVKAENVVMPPRVDTMQLMFAAGEMQTSGEPFASNFAGRNLADYDRYVLPPNLYIIHTTGSMNGFFQEYVDLFGFSTAVEDYEYSKYHMNMVANQTGAGVSLINGPLIAQRPGATLHDRLRTRMEQLIGAAGTDVGGFAFLPPPTDDAGAPNPQNDFGFPGLWPNLDPYRSFDPTMLPTNMITIKCTTYTTTGYGGVVQFGNNPVPVFECNYSTLRLNDRVAQTEHVIGPGILGYTTWKEALWAIDFVGRLHDSKANPVSTITPADVPLVGTHGNVVQGLDGTACNVAPPCASVTNCVCAGTYIGSTPLEGMWGLTMVDEIDNAGAWLMGSLTTSDGATLGGFPSVLSAITYDYGSPLVWFPTAVAVTEDGTTPYPGVSSVSVADATSHAVDLAALAQGYSLFFGMTDARNAPVGQQIGMQIAFDGTTFAADDGLPDGENTPHDRALAIMRVAFVDLDRIHSDPATGVIVDTATIGGGAVSRDTAVTMTSLGHVVIGLRHLLMACNAAVSQYGAPNADPSADPGGILDSVPIHPAGAGDGGTSPGFSEHVRAVLLAQAVIVRDVLTQADGTVANGATLANGKLTPTADATLLESQGAALRILTEAWFLTHDKTYLLRGQAVARKLLTDFWSEPALMFRGVLGGADDVVMTAERFAWLLLALRETYEALWVPTDPLLDRSALETRIARVNKLYLNGWDDLNGNQKVDYPQECVGAHLQLAEQTLTGELGTQDNGFPMSSPADREPDCVPNVSAAKVGSVLGQVHFHSP